MANKYTVGQGVVLTVAYTELTDPFAATYAAYDPATPTLKVEHPDGVTIETFTYPASQQILKEAQVVGKYYATIVADAPGTWRWKWLDPDPTKPGLVEGSFTASPPKIA